MRTFVYGEARELGHAFEEYVEPSHSVIVSIDMHQGHLADTPECPCPAPRAREIVGPIDRFHASARELGVPVIHVRSVLRRDGIDDVNGLKSAWRQVFPLYVGDIPNSDEHAIENSRWTEFVTEVEDGDLIVQTKKRLTAFYPSDLDFLLRNMRASTIVINGGMTDCCVLNTAFDGSNLGYRVIALNDLVRGTNAEMEDAALKMLSLHLGLVMQSEDLLYEWRQRRPSNGEETIPQATCDKIVSASG